jgi:hypothetical protein
MTASVAPPRWGRFLRGPFLTLNGPRAALVLGAEINELCTAQGRLQTLCAVSWKEHTKFPKFSFEN